MLVVLALMTGRTARADGPPDISEVLKRPAYRSAYEEMLKDRKGLPEWMATADRVADSTTSAGSVRVIDGREVQVFEMCKPDDCGRTGLVVMFSKDGETAKGFLSDDKETFLGDPTPSEKVALRGIIDSN